MGVNELQDKPGMRLLWLEDSEQGGESGGRGPEGQQQTLETRYKVTSAPVQVREAGGSDCRARIEKVQGLLLLLLLSKE